eukprot:1171445-Pleurochrysis_carterae.AAC.2
MQQTFVDGVVQEVVSCAAADARDGRCRPNPQRSRNARGRLRRHCGSVRAPRIEGALAFGSRRCVSWAVTATARPGSCDASPSEVWASDRAAVASGRQGKANSLKYTSDVVTILPTEGKHTLYAPGDSQLRPRLIPTQVRISMRALE